MPRAYQTVYLTVLPDGKNLNDQAHRLAWMIANGRPVPEPDPGEQDGYDFRGVCVIHLCDNGRCINPRHLKLGSHADNKEMQRDKPSSPGLVRGARSRSPLTARMVKDMCLLWHGGWSYPRLADAYGVSISCVQHVMEGRNWKDVTEGLRPTAEKRHARIAVDPELLEKARKLRARGMSYAAIGREVGRTAPTVHWWLNHRKVKE